MNVPYDEQVEAAMLGAALRDAEGLTVLMRLNAADFYKPSHSEAFQAAVYLSDLGVPVNVTTICNRLRESRLLDVVGGIESVRGWLVGSHGSQAAFYADKLRELSTRRKLIELSGQMLASASNEEEPLETVLDRLSTEFQTISEGEGTPEQTFAEGMRGTLDRIRDGVKNGRPPIEISTGLTPLDYWTNGLHRQELTVLAGRTSGGKTTLAVQIACHVAKRTGPVLLFSLEMPREEIHKRLYALEASIDMQQMRRFDLSDAELDKMDRAWKRLNKTELIIDDTSDVSLRAVRLKARQMRRPPCLIVVDYLQIMRLAGIKKENRTQELDEASKTLKIMARDFNCPVMVLSQLNRGVEAAEEKIPSLSHLRESGGIANNADNVLFVHSTYYDAKPGEQIPETVPAEIIIAKQRNGPRNVKVIVQWRPSCLRYEDPADVQVPEDEENAVVTPITSTAQPTSLNGTTAMAYPEDPFADDPDDPRLTLPPDEMDRFFSYTEQAS